MHLNDAKLRALVSSTRRAYDENAAVYVRATGTLDLFPGLDHELDRFFDALPGSSVLDLGCGAGRDAEYLIGRGAAVMAADLSEELLRHTRSRCAVDGAVLCDLLALPIAAGVFDGVWACASIVHLPSEAHPRVFSEIHRVLAPGGVTAISLKEGEGEGWARSVRMPSPRWFSLRRPEAVVDELAAAGFVSARVLPSGRGSWFVVEARKGLPAEPFVGVGPR
ncbi:class I SAM-dependent methyltransferase [Amycolatopsis sp. WAC 04169]|uniref:class I SAM-dependent DNA methyltransferase n=1 Tax=Amycolatopsis sp. WAC 04169 TaxID=2203197 RepID=UPI00131584EB|nr:class I SAM-dependent methyltransferase [Amycolatopsis sp. WAC 04169]